MEPARLLGLALYHSGGVKWGVMNVVKAEWLGERGRDQGGGMPLKYAVLI